MRFLLSCSGQGSRWNNYLGVPKHLIVIQGETLVQRTVRLLKTHPSYSSSDEIYILTFHPELYTTEGATCIRPSCKTEKEKEIYQSNPFVYVSKEWWSKTETTCILFGDVYFTEDAIDKIFHTIPTSEYQFYGRFDKSTITGCPYGEIFALSFHASFHFVLTYVLLTLKHQKDQNILARFSSWEVYRFLQGISAEKHEVRSHFTHINDFTDDFDFPVDYDRWISAFAISSTSV